MPGLDTQRDYAKSMVMNILIAVPSARNWHVKFGHHACELMYFLGSQNIETSIVTLQYPLISISRQNALESAIEREATHLLFLDDDMTFPVKTVEFLISRNEDCVLTNYARKSGKIKTNTVNLEGDNYVYSTGKTGIEEVSFGGLGVSLIKTSCFKDIPKPHFEILWNDEKQSYDGEDYYFFKKLKDNGTKIYVDHDASNLITHAGTVYHTNRGSLIFSDSTPVEIKKPS